MQEGPDHQTGFLLDALVPSALKAAASRVNDWWNAPPDYSREQALWDDWEENENDRARDRVYVSTTRMSVRSYKDLVNRFGLDPFHEYRISPDQHDLDDDKSSLFSGTLYLACDGSRGRYEELLLFWLQEKRVNPLTAPTNYFNIIELFKKSRTPRTLHAMMMSLDRSTPEQLATLYAIVKRREKATVSSPQELLNWGLAQGDEIATFARRRSYERYVKQLPRQETSTSNPILGSDTGDGEGNGVSPVPATELAAPRDSGSTSSSSRSHSDDDSYGHSHSGEAKKNS